MEPNRRHSHACANLVPLGTGAAWPLHKSAAVVHTVGFFPSRPIHDVHRAAGGRFGRYPLHRLIMGL